MTSTAVCHQLDIDYFPLAERKPEDSFFSTSTFLCEKSPYSDIALRTPNSCDLILPSPSSPTAFLYPNSSNLPNQGFYPDSKAFSLRSFDGWARWDNPADKAFTPASDFFPQLRMEPLELQGNVGSPYKYSSMSNRVEETPAVFGDDQMTEEPLFQVFSSMTELPRENLHLTPLPWSLPSARGTTPSSKSYNLAPILSPRQKSKLIAQAMPSQSYTNLSSPSSTSSAEPEESNKRKRKSTSSAPEDEEEDSPQPTNNRNIRHPPVGKAAHSMIEKRYRTNLNDKISALRDSIPSLQAIIERDSSSKDVQEYLQSVKSAHKLKKATILSKATEYISHLEKRNKILTKEIQALRSRVEAFEILMAGDQQLAAAAIAEKYQEPIQAVE